MSTLLTSHTSTDTYSYGYSGTALAQTFVVPSGYDQVDYVRVALRRLGTVSGNVTVALYATSGGYPTGSSLGSTTYAASSISTSAADWITFNWTDISVTPGARYAIVLTHNGTSSSNTIAWYRSSTASYGGGAGFYKYSGGAWTDWSKDFCFYAYGSASVSAPTVTTTAVASITATGATLGGNVTDDGGGTVSARGYVIDDTDTTPDKNQERTITDGSGTGAFSEAISGLSNSTHYFYRAWATNEAGTSYGSVVEFDTSATTPTVTSDTASNIAATTATASGTVSSDGGSTVTARGIAYGTSSNPTTAGDTVAAGSGTGSFSGNITGLSAATTYHYRAYATNAEGTSYGADKTFVTKTIVDMWGQSFTTVSAGTLTKVSLYLKETLADSSTATVKIYSDSSTAPDSLLATATKTITGSDYIWYDFAFNYDLSATTDYWIVLDAPYEVGVYHQYWGANSSGSYGDLKYTTDDGSTWSAGTGCAAFDLDVQPSLTVTYDITGEYKKRYL